MQYSLTTQTGDTEQDRLLINQLFDDLASVKPAWKQAIPSGEQAKAAKRQWLTAFKENNINTLELVKCGMEGARSDSSDFLPSPGKFIKWCRERSFIPLEKAWDDFIDQVKAPKHRRNWSLVNPALFWVYQEIGSYDCHQKEEKDLKPIFKRAYERALQKHLQGFSFKGPEALIPEELSRGYATPEKVNSTLHSIRKGLATPEVRRAAEFMNKNASDENEGKFGALKIGSNVFEGEIDIDYGTDHCYCLAKQMVEQGVAEKVGVHYRLTEAWRE